MSFTDAEKLEVIEQLIAYFREGDEFNRHHTRVLILKSIATEYRGRAPDRARAIQIELNRLIEIARSYRDPKGNYLPGKLTRVAHFVIGVWPTIQQALEKFEEQK